MTRPESPSTPQTLFEQLLRNREYGAVLQEITVRYLPLIRDFCRKCQLTGDEPDEVAQVVLLRLAQKIHGFHFDRTKSFRGWLCTVTRNEAKRFQRQEKRAAKVGKIGTGSPKISVLLNEQADDTNLTEVLDAEDYELKLYEQARQAVCAAVSTATWRAFEETTLENRPVLQVAKELGITAKAVYSAKARVLGMLRDEVARLQPPNTRQL
jgi:RNA polymerase sigma-70 factor, ECF subfamily